MKKGEKRRQMLLEIAYDLFIRKGYENTSVDDIIAAAQIAKGTYYYYFESKEQMLEEVIGMMISAEAENAKKILDSPVPVPTKIAGIISSMKPDPDETEIGDQLNRPENLLMHNKIQRRLIETIVPLLTEAVEQGISEGIFDCTLIPERVRILLLLGSTLFDSEDHTANDIEVFIDLSEKLLGARKGTMGFVKQLIL